jgi:hypothetical protein
MGEEPEKPPAGRVPKTSISLAQAAQALDAARREHQRLAEQRAQVRARLRSLGHAYHFVDLERGVRRKGPLIAADIRAHLEQMRTIAQHEGLSPSCVERIDKAARVGPKMPATIACVSRDVTQQVTQLAVTPSVALAMHAKLMPSYYRDRVAATRPVAGGAPLRAIAERLRPPRFEPGSLFSVWSPEAQQHLGHEAKRLATVLQRSSAHGEGRNGYVSLRRHQLRGRDLPRKRECFPTMHNFFLTRPDGTTAAERFFGQKPRSMFTAILASVELAPAPLSPPRKA